MTTQKKKIGIVHFRVGRTDGVSLEIEKRKNILETAGHQVKLVSGPVQAASDFIIEELEFDSPLMKSLREHSFNYFRPGQVDIVELKRCIEEIALKIESAFLQYHAFEKFDLLLLHNIFSLAINIPATLAFARIVDRLQIPTIATHHDYFWEREKYDEPVAELIDGYLRTYFPPNYANIHHVSINSIAQSELMKRRGITSTVLPDVFDFEQPEWRRDEFNNDFLSEFGIDEHDLVVLQATRIVERKGIEIAIKFVRELSSRKSELLGRPLYNGKFLNENTEIVLVLAGHPEVFEQEYFERVKREIVSAGIQARFAFDRCGAERRNGSVKKYSLWDAYVFADFVTYPSLNEGWGNQFIEAVFAKKPIALFEYPVYKSDIKKEGYSCISFGSKLLNNNNLNIAKIPEQTMRTAVDETLRLLVSEKTNEMLSGNFDIGRRFHDDSILEEFLLKQTGI